MNAVTAAWSNPVRSAPKLRPAVGPLGQRVRELRQRKGLNQTELADRLGATGSAITAIEAGRIRQTSYLPRLAQILEVPLAELEALAAQPPQTTPRMPRPPAELEEEAPRPRWVSPPDPDFDALLAAWQMPWPDELRLTPEARRLRKQRLADMTRWIEEHRA